MTRELAALGIDIDKDEAPADDTESHDSSAERHYKLRGRDESNKVLGSGRVTNASSPKIVKIKDHYQGPGYMGKSPKITKKGQECTICAETQGR